jgi:hypothetical protein
MEAITNSMNQLIPRENEFIREFDELGNREYLRNH